MWGKRRVLVELTASYDRKDREAREKQQAFNLLAAAYDQKWQEAVALRQAALGLEEEEDELRKQLLQLGDQEHRLLIEELCASHFRMCQDAASLRWVALGLEEELYGLWDLVLQVGDEIGADVEELRGQVLDSVPDCKDKSDLHLIAITEDSQPQGPPTQHLRLQCSPPQPQQLPALAAQPQHLQLQCSPPQPQ